VKLQRALASYELSGGYTYIVAAAVVVVVVVIAAAAAAAAKVKWGRVMFRINIKILYEEGAQLCDNQSRDLIRKLANICQFLI